jgi:hypothetical protein
MINSLSSPCVERSWWESSSRWRQPVIPYHLLETEVITVFTSLYHQTLSRAFQIQSTFSHALYLGLMVYTSWLVGVFLHEASTPRKPGSLYYRGFTITLRHTTVGRTPLDEWLPFAENSTWQRTIPTRDRQPYPLRDWNPQSQEARGHRPSPWTARPLGSACYGLD